MTGSSGIVGRVVAAGLRERWDIRGVDRSLPGDPLIPTQAVDLSEPGALDPHLRGVDAVIHLAASASPQAPWEKVLPNNIVATRGVFESCALAGVRRVVFASSTHVLGLYERDEPYRSIVEGRTQRLDPAAVPRLTVDTPPRPDGYYGVSKLFGEDLGRYYAGTRGLQVACLRIGWVLEDDAPRTPRQRALYLSHHDLLRFVEDALTREPLTFDVRFALSDNRWRFHAL
ncbi:MAG TPA: NAD(P)-dependent oxidoreductase [Candidatus Polarisedimenticolia bacterium]|nr:NAD(P)-dependent oxidoreductase [Candidatus Polarisedimenticolia bacterium]